MDARPIDNGYKQAAKPSIKVLTEESSSRGPTTTTIEKHIWLHK